MLARWQKYLAEVRPLSLAILKNSLILFGFRCCSLTVSNSNDMLFGPSLTFREKI